MAGVPFQSLSTELTPVVVGQDHAALPYMGESNSRLNMSASSNLESCSFYSGLIDDVRIYNRAVKP